MRRGRPDWRQSRNITLTNGPRSPVPVRWSTRPAIGPTYADCKRLSKSRYHTVFWSQSEAIESRPFTILIEKKNAVGWNLQHRF